MTNTIHISLDLETWGTDPGDDLRSIGACVFNPATGFIHNGSLGTIRPFYIATDNPTPPDCIHMMMVPNMSPAFVDDVQWYWDGVNAYRKYPLRRNPQTVEWWNHPDRAEASKAFDNPIDLREALIAFGDWLATVRSNFHGEDRIYAIGAKDGQMPNDLCIWGHGACMDPSVLAAAYRACGLPVPWHYRAPRDTRTAFDMAGVDDHSAFLRQFASGTFHHALDDSICQARAICEAFRMVRSPNRATYSLDGGINLPRDRIDGT